MAAIPESAWDEVATADGKQQAATTKLWRVPLSYCYIRAHTTKPNYSYHPVRMERAKFVLADTVDYMRWHKLRIDNPNSTFKVLRWKCVEFNERIVDRDLEQLRLDTLPVEPMFITADWIK